MAWTAKNLPDLTNKVAVVTGANSGIGFHTAAALARNGADVVMACRNEQTAEKAAAKINAAAGVRGQARVEKLDLSQQESVKAFTDAWEGPLDLLINNAGVMMPPKHRETPDGFELQFGTNHLGHHTLTAGLVDALHTSEAPRVVSVASIAHHGGDEKVLEANPASSYDPGNSYAQSKLANVLFARQLAKEAEAAGSPIVSVAAHPGVSATNLVGNPDGMGANRVFRLVGSTVLPLIFQSAKAGADPSLFAATEAEAGSYTGPQWLRESRGPIGGAKLSRHARNDELAQKLWAKSAELTGVPITLGA